MKTFFTFLDTLIEAPQEKKGPIEELINDAYRVKKVVFALDMSGFTVSVQRDGILAHLCRVRRMQLMTQPILNEFHGKLVKYEADNLLAVFESVDLAVKAAEKMQRHSQVEDVEEERKICFSIGIDIGRIIYLEDVDCFGEAVNFAHKLGEDLARPGEILVTEGAYRELGQQQKQDFTTMRFSVSGMPLKAHKR